MGKEGMSDLRVSITGIAWYRREDYDRIRTICADGDGFSPSYDDWLKAAEGLADRMKRAGSAFQKVYIDPDTFPAWCTSRGMNIDSKARIRFANEFVARRDSHRAG